MLIMWLKLRYNNSSSESFSPNSISVSMEEGLTVPISLDDELVRTSKIFPLIQENNQIRKINNAELYFFDFCKPYEIIAEISLRASDDFKSRIYFSNGSCSIILIAEERIYYEEFLSLNLRKLNGYEHWEVRDGKIQNMKYKMNAQLHTTKLTIEDYSTLPLIIRSILDESVASILVLKGKEKDHGNTDIILFITNIVNGYIRELKSINSKEKPIPETLFIDRKTLTDQPLLNLHIQNQIIDRLIQINSSLSYVSTQTLSGSIPILERRSIIRRSCLLGVGASMRALNRIVRYIEQSFASVNFFDIITQVIHKSAPLDGLESKIYDKKDWYICNIDNYEYTGKVNDNIYKLAYFSSRSAFRESEYAITASMNCITSGLSLSWTLMTITHEMLHSHVRLILTSIFYGKSNKSYDKIFTKFENKYNKELSEKYYMIDSLRDIILRYCIGVKTFGSISDPKIYEPSKNPEYNIKAKLLKEIFANEHRNISEILVHTLDLQYFYKGNTTHYILMIWDSWASLPNIYADLRQYILRSLLSIASTINQNFYDRFWLSIDEFKNILDENKEKLKNNPLISDLNNILSDKSLLNKYYFGAFKNSIILVDMVMNVFFSPKINSILWNDDNVIFNNKDGNDIFSYNIPLGFTNTEIKCPIPYLYDRMIKVINGDIIEENIERETAISFLAMN